MNDRDRKKLEGCHPTLVSHVDALLAGMAAFGFPMMVTDGVRTLEEQQAAFAKGRTTPGPNATPDRPLGDTVTNCDGVIFKSNHQAHEDLPGAVSGHAADLCFVVDGAPSWADVLPWDLFGLAAIRLGLKWGGQWTSRHDRPHVELP